MHLIEFSTETYPSDALAEALGDAAEHFYQTVRRGSVSRKELDELASALPSAIGWTGNARMG